MLGSPVLVDMFDVDPVEAPFVLTSPARSVLTFTGDLTVIEKEETPSVESLPFVQY